MHDVYSSAKILCEGNGKHVRITRETTLRNNAFKIVTRILTQG